jgi:DNA-binding transcriptional MocR family regulator
LRYLPLKLRIDLDFYYLYSDDLFPTCGASHGLYLLASQCFGPGDIVFVEELSFFLAVDMLSKDLKMKAVPVPMDKGGIKTKDLQQLIEKNLGKMNKDSGMPFRAMVYLIPVFHNPTGYCLQEERCSEVVRIAREYNLLVVCDDVYNLLSLSGVQHPRLYNYDKTSNPPSGGHIVSNGSFSKIFGPGVRMGWIEGPKVVLDKLRQSGYNWSGGGQNHYISGVVASVLQLGLQDQLIKEAREFYQKNARSLCQILEGQLPASVRFTKPQGGYFVWVELPTNVQAADVLDLCKKDGVEFFVGNL